MSLLIYIAMAISSVLFLLTKHPLFQIFVFESTLKSGQIYEHLKTSKVQSVKLRVQLYGMCIVVLGSEEIPTLKPSSKSPHIVPGFINICCLIGMKLQQICEEVNLCSDSQKKLTPCGLHSCTSYIKVCIQEALQQAITLLVHTTFFSPLNPLSLSLNHKTQNFLSVYLRLWTRNFFQITGKKRIVFAFNPCMISDFATWIFSLLQAKCKTISQALWSTTLWNHFLKHFHLKCKSISRNLILDLWNNFSSTLINRLRKAKAKGSYILIAKWVFIQTDECLQELCVCMRVSFSMIKCSHCAW
jgi:hypothetical protein